MRRVIPQRSFNCYLKLKTLYKFDKNKYRFLIFSSAVKKRMRKSRQRDI